MKRIVLIILATVLISNTCYSQSKSKAKQSLIVKALEKDGMGLHDMWLPKDYLDKHYHRLPIISKYFDDPVSCSAPADQITSVMQSRLGDNMDGFIQTYSELLDHKPIKLFAINESIPADLLTEELHVDLDSSASIVSSYMIKQYISPIVQVKSFLRKDEMFGSFDRFKLLHSYFDTVCLSSVYYRKFANQYFERDYREKYDNTLRLFFDEAKVYDKSDIIDIALSLYKHYYNLNKANLTKIEGMKESINSMEFNTPYGKVAIGGYENNLYVGDYALIVDFGGNDTYIMAGFPKNKLIGNNCRVIIDFEGDDKYTGDDYSLGGAVLGINILMDLKGNDTYCGGNVSLGSAIFGAGILHDFAGNDTYISKNFSQGAASFGIGLLIDEAGTDTYKAETESQAFGFVKGLGLLIDKTGNDHYVSSSPMIDGLRHEDRNMSFCQGAGYGSRNAAGGGVGVLVDYAGNDNYSCDIFGQGVAYWLAYGALVDLAGDDIYNSHQYAQGSGVHFGIGYFNDAKGNDRYSAGSVSLGCGHDVGIGFFLDESGEDIYTADNLAFGAGNANAVSIFIDETGNDSYFVNDKTNTMGWSDLRRGYGMPSLFIDAQGTDNYSSSEQMNNTSAVKGTFGVFFDEDNIVEKNESIKDTKPEVAEKKQLKPRAESLDYLFYDASAELLSDQIWVEPSRNAIINMKSNAFKFLRNKMDIKYPRDRIACEEILFGIYKLEPEKTTEFLSDVLESSKTNASRNMALRLIGRNSIAKLIPLVAKQAINPDWRVREIAMETLGLTDAHDQVPVLIVGMMDSIPLVRAKAAGALVKIFPDSIVRIIQPALNDKYKMVRYNASSMFTSSNKMSWELFYSLLGNDVPLELQMSFIKHVASLELEKSDYKKFKSTVLYQVPAIRREIYTSIKNSDKSSWEQYFKDLYKSEKNSELKEILKR